MSFDWLGNEENFQIFVFESLIAGNPKLVRKRKTHEVPGSQKVASTVVNKYDFHIFLKKPKTRKLLIRCTAWMWCCILRVPVSIEIRTFGEIATIVPVPQHCYHHSLVLCFQEQPGLEVRNTSLNELFDILKQRTAFETENVSMFLTADT